jgi:hypothetical protein
VNRFIDKLIYYLKDSILVYTYIIIGGLLGFIIMFMVSENYLPDYVGVILSVINIVIYAMVARNIFLKTGEEAMRAKHSNDIERRHMLETRTYHEINKVTEFNVKKIFIFCIITIVPLIVMLLVKGILDLSGSGVTGFDLSLRFVYGMVYSLFYCFSSTASVYFTAIAFVIVPLPIYIGYMQGVNKVKAEYLQAEQIKQKINGDLH